MTCLTSASASYSGAELAGLLVPGMALVEDPGQRDVLAHHGRRERLGDPVAEGVREAEHPAGVLDRGLGLDRAVGDDLRDLVRAPFLGHVPDHVGAATFVEVDVDVGHGHALGIEEALEDQAVDERVQVGDAHRVGDDRACRRAAARADRDAVVLRPHDEVRDHQEVGREPHLADDLDLVLGLLDGAARRSRPGSACPCPSTPRRGTGRPRNRSRPGWGTCGIRLMNSNMPLVSTRSAISSWLLRQPSCQRSLRSRRVHLGGGLDVVAAALEPEPVRVGQRLAGLDAQQHVVALGVRSRGCSASRW